MLAEKRWQPVLLSLLVILVLLSWLGANLSAAMTGLLAKGHLSDDGTSLLMVVIAVLGFQGSALVWVQYFLKMHDVTWGEAFGFSQRNYFQCLALVLILLPVVLAGVFLLSRGSEWLLDRLHELLHWNWLKPEPQMAVKLLQKRWPVHLLVVQGIATLIIAPIAEEVLFRGIFYTALKQRGHGLGAVMVTSILFALIHGYLAGFLSLILLAVLLVAVYERTKNLFAPILLHSLFNAVNFALIVANPRWAEDFFKT